MYLEKRVFVGISTLLQALCLGGGRGRGGRKEMTCNFTSFRKYFSHIRTMGGDNEWLFPMGPRQRLKRLLPQAVIDAGIKPRPLD